MAHNKLASIRAKIAETKRRLASDLDLANDSDALLGAPLVGEEVDALAEWKNELQEGIRKLDESVALVNAWESFRDSNEWSPEIRDGLAAIDRQIQELTGQFAGGPLPDPYGTPANDEIVPPPDDTALAPANGTTEVPPEPPVEPPAVPEGSPEPSPTVSASPKPAVAPVMASKNDYRKHLMRSPQAQSVSAQTRNANMPTPTKTASADGRERILASIRAKRATKITQEARVRVASAWVVAKTLLPNTNPATQEHFAKALLGSKTNVLKAVLRQTARNASFERLAERLAQIHKVEMNDLLADPSLLNKERLAVKSELNGQAKDATNKQADDRKECGPQKPTYDEGKREEPKLNDGQESKIDAEHAGDRAKDTINKSDETAKPGKEASAKNACGADCKGCEHCKNDEKKASAKTAEGELPFDAPPADGAAPPDPSAAAADVADNERKQELEEKIDQVQNAVDDLEAAIRDEEKIENDENHAEDLLAQDEQTVEGDEEAAEQELDLAHIFDEEQVGEKAANLANEDRTAAAEDAADFDFFAPTPTADIEAGLEDSTDPASIFASAEDVDPLESLISGKAAAGVEEPDLGDLLNQENRGDDRDFESDHESNILYEVADKLTSEQYGGERDKQDSTPELKPPKEASAKPAPKAAKPAAVRQTVQHIKPPIMSPREASINIEALLWPSDNNYGDFNRDINAAHDAAAARSHQRQR